MSRNAQRYEFLAAYARGRDYSKVSGPAVHSWVKRGLLPPVKPVATGFGQRAFLEPVQTGRQLLELCELRYAYQTRDTRLLGALLWANGFDLAEAAVRDGLIRATDLPVKLAEVYLRKPFSPQSPNAREQIANLAESLVFEHDVAGRLGRRRTPGLVIGLESFLDVLLGLNEKCNVDDGDTVDEVGVLVGLDRARRDRLPGVSEPWLTEPPGNALLAVAMQLRPQQLSARVRVATWEQLDIARERAALIAGAFEWYGATAEAAGRSGFAGIGRPSMVSPAGFRLLIVLAVLSFPAGARELVEQLPPDLHSG